MWKKMIALALAALTIVGCLTACGGETKPQENEPAAQTEPAAEAKVLKVLTLGHSLAVDSGHMLALIANAEGYQDMKVGTLYYSGCPLYRHVEFLKGDSREYDLYVSSTTTPNDPPMVTEDVSMRDALTFDYWDIIVMQGGVFEIAESLTYTSGDIQTIQEYVNNNKLNPNAEFIWNMTWVPPVDPDLSAMYPGENNTYVSNYIRFNNDRATMYNAVTKCVNDHILTDETFVDMIPSGTAMENALSSYMEEKDIHRDYVHASDIGRVITSYTWFCKLTGVEKLEEIKLDTVPKRFLKSIQNTEEWVLTDAEKLLVIESVNNALANPLQVTQSQYTEAPAAQ